MSTAYIVTGNRLRDGAPVYRAETGWTAEIARSHLLATAEEREQVVAAAAVETGPDSAVGAYAIEVALGEGGIRPVTLKERIRAAGPTVAVPGALSLAAE
jgi:hypothetical protein